MGVGGLSPGTQVNRYLDGLGLPDQFGDAVGALTDLQTGNLPGTLRNLFDLHSGLSTGQIDAVLGDKGKLGFGRCFMPRLTVRGPHMHACKHTYTTQKTVGTKVRPGEKYTVGKWGNFELTGRISKRQYRGSFRRPVRLAGGQYLYKGRKYQSLGAIRRDAADGKQTTRHTVYNRHMHPGMIRLDSMLGSISPKWNPMQSPIMGAIMGQPGGFPGGIPGGLQIPGFEGIGGAPGAGGGMAGGMAANQIADSMEKGPDGKKPNLQLMQSQIQQLMQQRQQMFQTMQNIMKSLHDTSMAAVRNMKA